MTSAVALALALSFAAPDLHVRPPAPALSFRVHDLAEKGTTQIALVATAALLLVLEGVIVRERAAGRVEPTISQVMAEWSRKYGSVPWVTGVMAGHWFLPGEPPTEDRVARRQAMILGWLTLGVIAWDVVDHSGHDRSRAPILLVGGIVAGHLLWTQGAR